MWFPCKSKIAILIKFIKNHSQLQVEGREKFKYRVKILNPKAKKESVVIDWHGVTNKFVAVDDLKVKLLSTLHAHLPKSSVELNIGYFHGRPLTKSWIFSEEDLQAMYDTGGKDILLWCDGKNTVQETSGKRHKKTRDDESEDQEEAVLSSKRVKSSTAEEKMLEEGIEALQSIHGDDYDYGQYRLWARMIKNHQWKD